MRSKTLIRRAAVAVAAAAMASVALVGPAAATIDTDLVRLTDSEVDFGDNTFIGGVPIRLRFRAVGHRQRLLHAPPRRRTALEQRIREVRTDALSYWDGAGGYI